MQSWSGSMTLASPVVIRTRRDPLTLYRASPLPKGLHLIQTLFSVLWELSPLNVNMLEGALELSRFGNRLSGNLVGWKVGKESREGWRVTKSHWPVPSHALPENISVFLGRVLEENPGANPESYRFEWMNEDGRHFLSLFNMENISLGLCTLSRLGSL